MKTTKEQFHEIMQLSNSGKYHEVLELIKTLEVNSKNLCLQGKTLECLGKTAEAISCFDNAIALNQDNLSAYYNKAKVLTGLDRKGEAIDCYNQCIKINPDYPNPYHDKGALLASLGQNEEALICFDLAIKYGPSIAHFYSSRGMALMSLKQAEEALKAFDQSIAVYPFSPDANYGKGLALVDLGQKKKAIDSFETALEFSKDSVQNMLILCHKAAIYQESGEKKQAYEDLKQAAKLASQEQPKLLEEDSKYIKNSLQKMTVLEAELNVSSLIGAEHQVNIPAENNVVDVQVKIDTLGTTNPSQTE